MSEEDLKVRLALLEREVKVLQEKDTINRIHERIDKLSSKLYTISGTLTAITVIVYNLLK